MTVELDPERAALARERLSGFDGDPVREFLLRDRRLVATELLMTPQSAAIVAVRR